MPVPVRCLAIFFLCLGAPAFSADGWFVTDSRAFPASKADPREAQFRIGPVMRDDGRRFLEFAMGGDLGLYQFHESDGSRLSLTTRGLLGTRFEFFSRSFDFQNLDAIGGLALGYAMPFHAFEFVFFHHSAHLGDDVLDQGLRPYGQLSYEAIQLGYSYQILAGLRVYTSIQLRTRAKPEKFASRTTIKIGAEANPFSEIPGIFTAVDVRMAEDDYFSPGVSLVIGKELRSRTEVPRPMRAFLELYRGQSYQGLFWDTRETYAMLGLGFTY